MATMPASNDSQDSLSAKLAGSIPQFVLGQDYGRRDDIHLNYGGSWQNGVSSSAVCPAIFLFTGDTGAQYGYKDDFGEAGVFSYTGEGQVGDMQFKGGNRSIRDHAQDGRALYLFRSLGKGKPQRYVGEFVLANHSVHRGPDRNGDARDVIVFHLMPVDASQDTPNEMGPAAASTPNALAAARLSALAACSGPGGAAGKVAVQTLYERSKAVRDYVLMRASGVCECCSNAAPFARLDGSPYLEVHHTTRLSDGGLDHPKHTAAICPNCHREIHIGANGVAKNKALQSALEVDW